MYFISTLAFCKFVLRIKIMNTVHNTWAKALVALATVMLSACTISTPYKSMPAMDKLPATQPVIVVVTYANVGTDRGRFYENVWLVADSMDRQPGLLGYSLRRELFGHQAWTMTAWQDQQSIASFASSGIHQQAIDTSYASLNAVRFARFETTLDELPLDWDTALELLETSASDYGS